MSRSALQNLIDSCSLYPRDNRSGDMEKCAEIGSYSVDPASSPYRPIANMEPIKLPNRVPNHRCANRPFKQEKKARKTPNNAQGGAQRYHCKSQVALRAPTKMKVMQQ